MSLRASRNRYSVTTATLPAAGSSTERGASLTKIIIVVIIAVVRKQYPKICFLFMKLQLSQTLRLFDC